MGKEELVIGMYVDDLSINGFKREMAARFRMSDLGILSYYLGIEVRQGKEKLMLCQSAYA